MKYSEFFTRVAQNVREQSAWPEDSSKISEQIHLSWIAALSIGAEIPLTRLDVTSEVLNGTAHTGTSKTYPLPDDIFELRGDLGFSRLEIDGEAYYSNRAVPINTLLHMANNPVHAGEIAFSLDQRSKILYVINAVEVKYFGARAYSAPAEGDVGTTDYPLDETDVERAAQLVGYHLNGVTIRDTAAAQFNALLINQYGGSDA